MAGDIRGLLDAVGAQRVHIVARDIGLMVGYALAAQWPERVASMTMLDVPLPGTGAWEQAKGDPQTWHFGLHRQRDVAETLVTGREYDYISTFYRARLRRGPGTLRRADGGQAADARTGLRRGAGQRGHDSRHGA
ncbi:alpha/beta hydrolase [Streptomyces sp. CA-142005]|uniref:alpha/beta hydrolase n=1 Tax=Streptomyces sp. CA-142005 TaxID=3240052 RepID=UPI003D8D4E1B